MVLLPLRNLYKKTHLRFEYFIARRQLKSNDKKRKISGSLVNVTIFGVALCIAVMIISIAILQGFKNEIRNKVVGFGSHIQILNYDSNSSYETTPISNKQDFIVDLKNAEGIKHVQQFATKAGILKTESDIQGVVLKGVGTDFSWDFFQQSMVEGKTFAVKDSEKTNEIIISRYIAKLLKLKVGDEISMYFIQDPPRVRVFTISGIYETSVEEFDKIIVLCDIKHIQKLNNWTDDQISGFEVFVNKFDDIDKMTVVVNDIVGYSFMENGQTLQVLSIKQKYPQIFDWVNLQDLNVMIIIILMLVVCGFNMIAGLLILILDRTELIGLLKALGSTNKRIRRIFLFESVFIIFKGLFWGNLVGLAICLGQQYTKFLKLDASSYYIDHVPILLDPWYIVLLNVGVVIATLLFLIIPSSIISRFSPAEIIRFK